MDPAILAILSLILETANTCVKNGASASNALSLTEKVFELLPESKKPEMWSVWLLSYGENKIQCIRVVRQFTDLGLKDAKELVESAPVEVLITSNKEEAIKMFNCFKSIINYSSEFKVKVELRNSQTVIFS